MQSTFEWRRIAPAGFSARAHNARFCAAALWQLKDGKEFSSLAAEMGYRATPQIAYGEAFRREAAIALELIVKAVIAQQMHMRRADPTTEGVPATHNLPALWEHAGLPKLGTDDCYRLLLFKSILMWSGRYATPNSAKAWAEEEKALEVLDPATTPAGHLRIRQPIGCGWSEFDALYSIAARQLLLLQMQ